MLNLRPNFWKIFLGHFIPIYTNYYYLTWWKKSEKNYDFPFVQVKKSLQNLIFDPFLAYLAQKMAENIFLGKIFFGHFIALIIA